MRRPAGLRTTGFFAFVNHDIGPQRARDSRTFQGTSIFVIDDGDITPSVICTETDILFHKTPLYGGCASKEAAVECLLFLYRGEQHRFGYCVHLQSRHLHGGKPDLESFRLAECRRRSSLWLDHAAEWYEGQ